MGADHNRCRLSAIQERAKILPPSLSLQDIYWGQCVLRREYQRQRLSPFAKSHGRLLHGHYELVAHSSD